MTTLAQSYNFQTQGKWLMVIPWNLIDNTVRDSNFTLNLYNFRPPAFSVGTTTMSAMGHSVTIPTNNMTDSKTLGFNYIMSSDMSQYIFLYNWWRSMVTSQGTGFSLKNQKAADVRIYLIDEFKEKTLELLFKRCWVQEVGEPTMDMQNGDALVTGTFQLYYFSMEMKSLKAGSVSTKDAEILARENPL